MSNYIHGAYGKPKGINTTQRIVGKSAYEIAVEHGFVGSEEEWLESLKGKSAYEVAVDLGYEGTADEWVESIGMAMGIDLVDELTDLKDDLNEAFGLLYNGNPSAGTVLVTSSMVSTGDVIYYDFDANVSDKTAYIEVLDSNNQRLAIFGKISSSLGNMHFEGSYVIPSGFGSIKYNTNASVSNSATINYIGLYMSLGSIGNNINNLNNNIVTIKTNITVPSGSQPTQIIFTKDDVHEGEIIEVFLRGSSAGAFYLQMMDSSNQVLANVGKTSSGNDKTSFCGTATIPTGFSYAKVKRNNDNFNVYVDYVLRYTPVIKRIDKLKGIESTGDTTDRSADILNALNSDGIVNLGAGVYYINSTIIMPSGSTIRGAGDKTILIASDSSMTSIINCTTENTIDNVVIKGLISSTPSSLGTMNGINILQTNSNNRIINCYFWNLSGSGVYASNTYDGAHNSNVISNCRFFRVGCGVYIGERAEAYVVSDCTVLNAYIGIHCIGGNNRITENLVRSCSIGIDMKSVSTTDNDGHSVFANNVIIHNTHAIMVDTIEFGSVFNGCSVFYGDVIIKDSAGILFIGCMFGSLSEVTAISSLGIRVSNSIFRSIDISDVTGITLNNCTDFDGIPFLDSVVETISDSNPVIVAEEDHRYVCGEVLTLSITPLSEGITDVVFTSGSTVAVLTIVGTVQWPDWFDPTALEANTRYEINIMDGLGVVNTWQIS